MDFVDANIFLRYLTKDSPSAAQKCFELFQRVQHKEIQLVTSESVLAEVVYVLASPRLYNQPRQNVRTLLLPLVHLKGLKISNRKLVLRALDVYATTNLDFEDALSVAHMENKRIKTIVSYDHHFDRMNGIQCIEP